MRDVYKDEEIGFAQRFEKERQEQWNANHAQWEREKMVRDIDKYANLAYKNQKRAEEAERKVDVAYQEGYDKAVADDSATIRHLNNQITGFKSVITTKNRELEEKNEIIARNDEETQNKLQALATRLIEEVSNNYISKDEHNKVIKRVEEKAQARIDAADEFAYDVLQENYDLKQENADLKKRMHLMSVLANTDKPLPGGIK